MRVAILSAALLASGACASLAKDCSAPCVGTKVSLGLEEDYIFAADPSELKANSLQPEITLESFFMPAENFKLVSKIAVEQVISPESGENSTFEDIGAYVDELYAELAFEPVTVRLGKIDPIFSLAESDGDGINSDGLAGDVDASKSLGAEISANLALAGHSQLLTGTVFAFDRSFLAQSIFTKRDVRELSDGGAGNTRGLSSVSLVLNGCFKDDAVDCDDGGSFGYRLGARYRGKGRQTEDQAEDGIAPRDEFAFLAAAQSHFDVGASKLRLMGEASYIENFRGDPDDVAIFTGIASLEHEALTTSLALSHLVNFEAGEENTSENLVELAVEYEPDNDLGLPDGSWSLGASYTYSIDDDDDEAHLLSLRLDVEFGGTREFR
jgi:hypothetical protein